MKLSRLTLVFCGSLLVLSNLGAQQLQRVYINDADLPDDPGPQRGPVWCWAASISYIFAYYHHVVPQDEIVSRFYGRPVNVPGNPRTMSIAFNSVWTDANGQSFSVRAAITDRLWHTASNITNRDVVAALENNVPVFFGTTNHAMVLVSAEYYDTISGQPVIVSGKVWDPNPMYHGGSQGGLRLVYGNDLSATFAAIPDLSGQNGGAGTAHRHRDPNRNPQGDTSMASFVARLLSERNSGYQYIKAGRDADGNWNSNYCAYDATCQVYSSGTFNVIWRNLATSQGTYDNLYRELTDSIRTAVPNGHEVQPGPYDGSQGATIFKWRPYGRAPEFTVELGPNSRRLRLSLNAP